MEVNFGQMAFSRCCYCVLFSYRDERVLAAAPKGQILCYNFERIRYGVLSMTLSYPLQSSTRKQHFNLFKSLSYRYRQAEL